MFRDLFTGISCTIPLWIVFIFVQCLLKEDPLSNCTLDDYSLVSQRGCVVSCSPVVLKYSRSSHGLLIRYLHNKIVDFYQNINHSWITHHLYMIHGLSIDYLRIISESSIDHPLIIYGSPINQDLWITDHIWISHL